MKTWLCGKRGGLLAFVAIAALVTGGLGFVTAAVLRLEREQLASQAETELQGRLRLALWRLDSYMIPELAREASRPVTDYSAIVAPAAAFDRSGRRLPPGTVLELSPLVHAEMPAWMLLHFTVSPTNGWWSPQLLDAALRKKLQTITDVPAADEPRRQQLLQHLAANLKLETLLVILGMQEQNKSDVLNPTLLGQNWGNVQNKNGEPTNWNQQNPQGQGILDYQARAQRLDPNNDNQKFSQNTVQARNNTFILDLKSNKRNILDLSLLDKGQAVAAIPGPMAAMWLPTKEDEQLVFARRVQVNGKQVCQGIVLDWPVLRELLTAEIQDLFAAAQLQPMREAAPPRPERTMTALPVELDPGSLPPVDDPGWTPLRLGLALAWSAALIALGAVGLGGWSLIDLSQRRIRFVSTVTHELRTPLTTLRLYLDMLTSGMVRDEQQKTEYLQTLNTETDRLHRLVNNVLDFSRLENQRPRLNIAEVKLVDLLVQVQEAWLPRCQECDKELILENLAGAELALLTDVNLVQQLLGNLIDNACKYSRGAADRRLWLRAYRSDGGPLILEVADMGPGVPASLRRAIFRPFCRGGEPSTTAGVGLGLALSVRWARLLGGQLTLHCPPGQVGACFRLELAYALPKA